MLGAKGKESVCWTRLKSCEQLWRPARGADQLDFESFLQGQPEGLPLTVHLSLLVEARLLCPTGSQASVSAFGILLPQVAKPLTSDWRKQSASCRAADPGKGQGGGDMPF